MFSEGSHLAIVDHEHRQVSLDQAHAAVNLAGEEIFDDQDAAIRLQRLTALAEYQGGSFVVPGMQYGHEHKKVAPWYGGKKVSGYYLGTSRESSPGQVGRSFLRDSRDVVHNSSRS